MADTFSNIIPFDTRYLRGETYVIAETYIYPPMDIVERSRFAIDMLKDNGYIPRRTTYMQQHYVNIGSDKTPHRVTRGWEIVTCDEKPEAFK